MQFPIFIGLRRSFLLDAIVATAHWAPAVAVQFVGWPLPWAMALSFVALLSWLAALQQCRLRIEGLKLSADGLLEVRRVSAESWLPVSLDGPPYVHPRLVALVLRGEDGRRIPLVLLSDSLAAEEFRRLRVWLRWKASLNSEQHGA